MNKNAKLFILLFSLCFGATILYAQEEETINEVSPLSIGADFTSRYIWRGLNLGGSSTSIQPCIEYGFGSENHAFAVGFWGAYSFSGMQTGQEVDLYVSYTFNDMFSLLITDYFFPDETIHRNGYLNFNTDWTKIDSGTKDQTRHLAEATISFNGTEKIPVSLLFAMNIWGADSRKYKEQAGIMVPENKIVMSKYLELGYSFEKKGIAYDLFAGMVLTDPEIAKAEPAGFYGQRDAGIINLGLTVSKELELNKKFSLPLSCSFITNPEAENIFLVLGLSF